MTSLQIQLRRHPPSALSQTLEKLPSLCDNHVGVIHSIEYTMPRSDDPQFAHCTATLADVAVFTGRRGAQFNGGTALTREVALGKAVGEAIERYCVDVADCSDVEFGAYRDLGAVATDPRRFVLFHSDQYGKPGFPFVPITDASEIGWVQGFSLTRSEETLVPASLVHFTYVPPHLEQVFEVAPLSGYACGNTMEEAILRALCEVVERDAFMVFWYNWLPVPAVRLDLLKSLETRQALDRYHPVDGYVSCASITTDIGIPAIVAVLTSSAPSQPAAVVATAADVDPEKAVARALYELASNRLLVRYYLESGAKPIPRWPWQVIDQEDHGLFFCDQSRLNLLDPLLRPRWSVNPGDIAPPASFDVKENIERCVGRLEAVNLEVIVVDLTSPEVDELGFKVVKVLIPGMQPIDFGGRWPHLGGRRLYEVPRRLGYPRCAGTPSELNLFPHPFP